MSSSRKAGYRPHLDGIRAALIVMVLAFHLGYTWIPGGFIAVDVFFVLSGYLITGILLEQDAARGGISIARFYARRVRRLLPAALVTLGTVVAASTWLFDPVERDSLRGDAIWGAVYSANIRFIRAPGDYFAPGDVPSPLIHFWSLAVEEQFYLVWPVALVVMLSLARRWGPQSSSLRLVLVAVVSTAVVSAAGAVVTTGTHFAYYGLPARSYQLLAGGALAIAMKIRSDAHVAATGGPPPPPLTGASGPLLVIGGVAVLGWFALQLPDVSRYPGAPGIAVTLASLALIAGLDLAPDGLHRRLFGAAGPAAIGRGSYSIYLWHWPVMVFVPLIADRWGQGWLRNDAVLLCIIAVIAGISYFRIERPIRFRVAPRARPRRVALLGLACSITTATIVILLAPRLSPFQGRALASVTDRAPAGDCPYSAVDWAEPGKDVPCVWRRGTGPTYALVGDSHAQMWQPALEVLAARTDATIIRVTRQSCPANDVTHLALNEDNRRAPDTACTRWRHRVFPALIERYDPDLVFVATRSHVQTIAGDGGAVPPEETRYLAEWEASWDWTLTTLGAGTGTVVVSTPTPAMRDSTPGCLIDHEESPHDCDMRASADRTIVGPTAVTTALPRRHPEVLIVDPVRLICPDGLCPAVMDSVIVHRDDDHLSASWTRAHADELGRLLTAAGARLS